MAAALPFGSTTATDKEAPSSIQIAAGDGLLDLVKQFVESGVSVNAADENGYTAMHAAASYGEVEVLNWLLQNGADPNAVDDEGDTPLHSCESPECAATLLASGSKIDVQNKLGMYPIQTIAANEDDDTAEALLPLYSAAGISLPNPLVPINYQYGELVDGAPFVDEDGDIETDFPDA